MLHLAGSIPTVWISMVDLPLAGVALLAKVVGSVEGVGLVVAVAVVAMTGSVEFE